MIEPAPKISQGKALIGLRCKRLRTIICFYIFHVEGSLMESSYIWNLDMQKKGKEKKKEIILT